jgi:hypothetical protein
MVASLQTPLHPQINRSADPRCATVDGMSRVAGAGKIAAVNGDQRVSNLCPRLGGATSRDGGFASHRVGYPPFQNGPKIGPKRTSQDIVRLILSTTWWTGVDPSSLFRARQQTRVNLVERDLS